MSNSDALRKAIESKNVVLVVGAGVSAAATDRDPIATWPGLIRNGIERIASLGAPNSEWQGHSTASLEYALKNGDIQSLIQTASSVKAAFSKIGTEAYAKWLCDTVGGLQVVETGLLDAILGLPFPILTTNYDTLLEARGSRATASWVDYQSIQRVLSGGDSNAIGHLHGVWNLPDSVVLSTEDYSQHLHSKPIQELQHAISSIKSIIYIGFGGGLADPNFAALLQWHRVVFANSATSHFRLCLESEIEALSLEHASDQISVVPYGSNHSALPRFLSGLTPSREDLVLTSAGIARNTISEAQSSLAETLVADSIIAETSADRAVPDDVIAPPPILPVPHHEYVRAKSKRGDKRIHRVPPEEVIGAEEVTILVGGDGEGLTTAINWLAWKASIYRGAAPICVNFRDFSAGPNPLQRRVVMAALQTELIARRSDDMPPHVLAIDDFSPFVPKISDNAITEVSRSSATRVLIGCKQGNEDELLRKLRLVGVEPKIRFIGSLETKDVRELAQRASPLMFEELTQQVVQLLVEHDLPRTPFAVSLILSVLVQGQAVAAAASQTAVLEQYVALLLGRGNPHEDARTEIDPQGREAVLTHLAQFYVERGSRALSEADVVGAFEATFHRWGWKESPTRLLTSLISRRVLKRDADKLIHFAQNSYLYLFAAKRAQSDSGFRDQLLTQPLYFAPVLTTYAALQRNDRGLLLSLRELLTAPDHEPIATSTFEVLPPEEILVGEFVESRKPEQSSDLPVSEPPDALELNGNSKSLDLFQDESDITSSIRLMRAIDLVSTTLRDSDQIDDLELKTETLLLTLDAWGELMWHWGNDDDLLELVASLTEEVEWIAEEREKSKTDLVEAFRRMLPALLGFGGINATLATRRLSTILSRAVAVAGDSLDDEAAVAAVFLAIAIRDNGWPAQVVTILKGRPNTWVIRYFVLWLCEMAYIQEHAEGSDEAGLIALVEHILTNGASFRSQADRIQFLANRRTSLSRRRLLAQGRRKEIAMRAASQTTEAEQ